MDNASLVVFSNEEFGKVRTVGTPDDPKFCLADICRSLELRVDGVVARLKEDPITAGVLSQSPVQTAGGIQQMYFVNEDGLYDVILDSRKPAAKKFRKWITSEVLPSIRKTGSYSNKPAQVQEKLFRFLAGTSHITDPESQRMLTSVFVSTLREAPQEVPENVPEPVRSQDPRAKDPDIETITMQELFDDYVVPLDLKSIPDSSGKPTLTSLYNFVHTYHPEAFPKVVSPYHFSKRRNRLVDRRRIDIIINDLKNYIK